MKKIIIFIKTLSKPNLRCEKIKIHYYVSKHYN
jgi:hypothetical protein